MMSNFLRCRRCRVYTVLCLLVFAAWFYVQGYPAYRAARFWYAWEAGDIETLNAMSTGDVVFGMREKKLCLSCPYIKFLHPERFSRTGDFFFDQDLILDSNASVIMKGYYRFVFRCDHVDFYFHWPRMPRRGYVMISRGGISVLVIE